KSGVGIGTRFGRLDAVDTHGLRDVVEPLLAEIGIHAGELASYLIVDVASDADTARLRKLLQPRSDVDAVAVNCVALGNHITQLTPIRKALHLSSGRLAFW